MPIRTKTVSHVLPSDLGVPLKTVTSPFSVHQPKVWKETEKERNREGNILEPAIIQTDENWPDLPDNLID